MNGNSWQAQVGKHLPQITAKAVAFHFKDRKHLLRSIALRGDRFYLRYDGIGKKGQKAILDWLNVSLVKRATEEEVLAAITLLRGQGYRVARPQTK